MHHLTYLGAVLHAEAVNLVDLVVAVGTQFYCYSKATLAQHYQLFAGAFADVDARTHAKIATGKAENKFGIPISRARAVYARAAKLPGIEVSGVDMHIGSQITELAPFNDAFALLSDFVRALRADGHRIGHID